jgi:putative ABC transport system permease protein
MKKSVRMLVPAGVAILIGTAFIAATFLFGNAMNDSLSRQTTAQFGGANYVVGVDAASAKGEKARQYVYSLTASDFNLDRIRATTGVNGARADVSGSVVVTNGDKHANSYAVSTAKQRSLLPVSIDKGDQPVDSNEIALPKSVAEQLDVTVGDSVTINSKSAQYQASADASADSSADASADSSASASSGEGDASDAAQNDTASGVKVRVTGITEDTNGAYSYYGGASVLSDNAMAAMLGADDFGKVHAMTIYLDIADTNPDEAKAVVNEIKQYLPKYFATMTRQSAADEAIKSLGGGDTNVVTIFLLSFGVLAMLVAALVIANTFQVLVAQRRRTLALLRTIGAKKSQLYASVLFEAGILGLIASLLGVALGIGLMAALCGSGLMESTGMPMRLIITWPVFAVPIIFGVIMTVIASLSSARSATAVTPLEALRPIELTNTRRAGAIRAIVSVLLLVAGFALVGFAVWQMLQQNAGHDSLITDQYSVVLLMSIGGCALIFLGLVLSATFWLPVLMRGAGALVSLCGPSAKVAHANIQKNPRRVAATGAALLIGVTLVSTIATGAASGKETMSDALATRYSVDMVAVGSDMTDKQAAEAAKVKGVKDSVYAPTRMMSVKDSAGNYLSVLVVGVDGTSALSKVMQADLSGASVDEHTVLMPKYDAGSGKEIAFDKGKDVEFKADAPGASGSGASGSADNSEDGSANASAGAGSSSPALTLKPEQVDYRRVSSNYSAVAFVDTSHFADGGLTADGHILLMRIDAEGAGTTLSDTLTNVQNTFSASAGVSVSGPVAERMQWETMINAMMALLVGLIAVAVLIALVGVANTLSLSVIERTRESATLRAIGMTRGQLRRSLAVEALLLALVAGVVGVALGTLFGWTGSFMVFSLYGQTAFPFEWGTNGIVLGVAAIAALLASVSPARRAIKTPPVEALAEA